MTDSKKISKYFTWKEAIYLQQWNREATEEDGLTDKIRCNLIKTFGVMDRIRILVGRPIIVHRAYSPVEYNKLVGGAKRSAHLEGLACDFHVSGMDCDEVRDIIKNFCKAYGFRLEWNPNSNWCHIDCRKPYGPFNI
jgi:uncharacterized protein YcbK (DUF882 family)